MNIQTYLETASWKGGDTLQRAAIVDKDEAHNKALLHLSAHLVILDENGKILARKRLDDDKRYAGKWTSAIGTHVEEGDNYVKTLEKLLPVGNELEFVGEFRVHDEWENEINGLYLMRVKQSDLKAEFLADKKFFSLDELRNMAEKGETTPNLKESLGFGDKIK